MKSTSSSKKAAHSSMELKRGPGAGWTVPEPTFLFFFRSSVGLKIIMALTGTVLLGFLLGHMLGNLQIFLGASALNTYAKLLHAVPELLWVVRMVLIACVVLHILSGLGLWFHNRTIRPISYRKKIAVGSSWASRSMALSGLIVLSFLVYHLLHFTLGTINPRYLTYQDSAGRRDVFRMLVEAFLNPWVAGFYVLGLALLCLHLSHGVASLFRSLGWMNSAYRPWQIFLAYAVSGVLFVGFSAVPISIQLGFIKITTP